MINKISPLVSVIIPCYNYGNYLKFTLESILSQKYTEWECIIIDDGSTDNTQSVANEFVVMDKRFRYVYQDNTGPSGARNRGIANSRGEYIQFLDSDDLIHADKIKLQVNYLEQHQEADLVFGDALFFDTLEPPQGKFANAVRGKYTHLKVSGKGSMLVRNLCINNFIEISCPLVRKSLINKTGDFDISYFTYEDWQYWFRAAVKGVYFAYEPIPGTETYISYGHSSLLGDMKKCFMYGVVLRKYMMPFLPGSLKIYNSYRMLKLKIKSAVLSLNKK